MGRTIQHMAHVIDITMHNLKTGQPLSKHTLEQYERIERIAKRGSKCLGCGKKLPVPAWKRCDECDREYKIDYKRSVKANK